MTPRTDHPAITLSRTLGSGGSLIAYHVAQKLGWRGSWPKGARAST